MVEYLFYRVSPSFAGKMVGIGFVLQIFYLVFEVQRNWNCDSVADVAISNAYRNTHTNADDTSHFDQK